MTEGRQVQDFIKSQKKTARERFEEAGWTYKEYIEAYYHGIEYSKDDLIITFDISEKGISSSSKYDSLFIIDMETLKLIIAQCKELRWL